MEEKNEETQFENQEADVFLNYALCFCFFFFFFFLAAVNTISPGLSSNGMEFIFSNISALGGASTSIVLLSPAAGGGLVTSLSLFSSLCQKEKGLGVFTHELQFRESWRKLGEWDTPET